MARVFAGIAIDWVTGGLSLSFYIASVWRWGRAQVPACRVAGHRGLTDVLGLPGCIISTRGGTDPPCDGPSCPLGFWAGGWLDVQSGLSKHLAVSLWPHFAGPHRASKGNSVGRVRAEPL